MHNNSMTPRSVHSNEEERELQNLSFTSHISNLGHGQAGGADLQPIAEAAARTTSADNAPDDPQRLAAELSAETTMGIVKKFLITGIPLSFAALAQFSLNMVIIAVIGKLLGDKEMGGASLALGLLNATGFAFGFGLCGAVETVFSHTYGKFHAQQALLARMQATAPQHPENQGGENHEEGASSEDVAAGPKPNLYMYGTYAQRMAIILFIAAIPLGLILCFADSALHLVGEKPAAVHFTGMWCRYAIFGLPATLAMPLIQRYYSCQHITRPLSVAMVIAALANPALQIAFVKLFGFAGSPFAWLLLMTSIVTGLVWYLSYSGIATKTWNGWNHKALENVWPLACIALPSMGVMMSEWVALEVNALAAGFAPHKDLAAYSITLQLFGIMWALPSGVIILTCVFVGNAIGGGQPMLGRRISFIAIVVVFCMSAVDVLLMWILMPYIPYAFTDDPEVAQIAQRLMYVVMPYHFFDGFQSTIMGIFRGCEMQKLGALVISIAFCVFGLPISFILFFRFKLGVIALWIGPFAGVAGVGAPIYIYIILRYIKWETLKAHTENEATDVLLETEMMTVNGTAAAANGAAPTTAGAASSRSPTGREGTSRVPSSLHDARDELPPQKAAVDGLQVSSEAGDERGKAGGAREAAEIMTEQPRLADDVEVADGAKLVSPKTPQKTSPRS